MDTAIKPSEQTELLPCPFCGRAPTLKHVPSQTQSGFYWWIGCEIQGTPNRDLIGCGIGHSAWTESEAVAKWNQRATHTVPTGEQMRCNCAAEVRRYLEDCRLDERGIIEAIAEHLESLTPTAGEAVSPAPKTTEGKVPDVK